MTNSSHGPRNGKPKKQSHPKNARALQRRQNTDEWEEWQGNAKEWQGNAKEWQGNAKEWQGNAKEWQGNATEWQRSTRKWQGNTKEWDGPKDAWQGYDRCPEESQPAQRYPEESQPAQRYPEESQPTQRCPEESQPAQRYPEESPTQEVQEQTAGDPREPQTPPKVLSLPATPRTGSPSPGAHTPYGLEPLLQLPDAFAREGLPMDREYEAPGAYPGQYPSCQMQYAEGQMQYVQGQYQCGYYEKPAYPYVQPMQPMMNQGMQTSYAHMAAQSQQQMQPQQMQPQHMQQMQMQQMQQQQQMQAQQMQAQQMQPQQMQQQMQPQQMQQHQMQQQMQAQQIQAQQVQAQQVQAQQVQAQQVQAQQMQSAQLSPMASAGSAPSPHYQIGGQPSVNSEVSPGGQGYLMNPRSSSAPNQPSPHGGMYQQSPHPAMQQGMPPCVQLVTSPTEALSSPSTQTPQPEAEREGKAAEDWSSPTASTREDNAAETESHCSSDAPEPRFGYAEAVAEALRRMSQEQAAADAIQLPTTQEMLRELAVALLAAATPTTIKPLADLVGTLSYRVPALTKEVAVVMSRQFVAIEGDVPPDSAHGVILFAAQLFVQNGASMAVMKELFMTLLFTRPQPLDHSVLLSCHALLSSGPTLERCEVGHRMVEYVILRLKELKGGKYTAETRQGITEICDLRHHHWVNRGYADSTRWNKMSPQRRFRRGRGTYP